MGGSVRRAQEGPSVSSVTQLPTEDAGTDPPREPSNVAPDPPLRLPGASKEAEVFLSWGRVVSWLGTLALKSLNPGGA